MIALLELHTRALIYVDHTDTGWVYGPSRISLAGSATDNSPTPHWWSSCERCAAVYLSTLKNLQQQRGCEACDVWTVDEDVGWTAFSSRDIRAWSESLQLTATAAYKLGGAEAIRVLSAEIDAARKAERQAYWTWRSGVADAWEQLKKSR